MKKRMRGRLVAAVILLGMAAVPTVATAATPPTATTGGASLITASSAVVTATINPNGAATTYVVQYGPTTSYGSQTTSAAAGSGTSSVSVQATLNALLSGTTYHFRVVATSSVGTATGADATFATTKTPPNATVGLPSLVTSTSAVLTGAVDPNGKATTDAFQYGPTTSYELQSATATAGAGTASSPVQATLSGLTAGATYHYRLIANSADGTTVSADATFVTIGHRLAATGALPVVSEAGAVKIAAHAVQLNGAINPEGPSTTWYFEYGLTTNYGVQTSPQTMTGVGARPINVQLNALQSGTTYHFRLVANSANGLYVGPDHSFATKQAARVRPGALAVNAAAAAHRSYGVTIAISGHLQLPAALTAAAGCNGTVAIETRRGNATIALRRTSLRPDCTYSLNMYIAANRLHGATRLGIFARYSGNAVLLPTASYSSSPT